MNQIILILVSVFMCSSLWADNKNLTNPTLETIFQRKSVRHFAPGTITKEQMEMLVRAGMAAPTAMDKRPWEFIVITDKNVLNQLAAALPHAKMAAQAEAGIIVLGDMTKENNDPTSVFWVMDCSAATENILLAAESMKLGAVWTALYPDKGRIEAARKVLKFPDNKIPLNFIPIGIPTGVDKPKDKYNKDQIHWNKW